MMKYPAAGNSVGLFPLRTALQTVFLYGLTISSRYFLQIRHCYIADAQQTQQKTHGRGFDADLL